MLPGRGKGFLNPSRGSLTVPNIQRPLKWCRMCFRLGSWKPFFLLRRAESVRCVDKDFSWSQIKSDQNLDRKLASVEQITWKRPKFIQCRSPTLCTLSTGLVGIEIRNPDWHFKSTWWSFSGIKSSVPPEFFQFIFCHDVDFSHKCITCIGLHLQLYITSHFFGNPYTFPEQQAVLHQGIGCIGVVLEDTVQAGWFFSGEVCRTWVTWTGGLLLGMLLRLIVVCQFLNRSLRGKEEEFEASQILRACLVPGWGLFNPRINAKEE